MHEYSEVEERKTRPNTACRNQGRLSVHLSTSLPRNLARFADMAQAADVARTPVHDFAGDRDLAAAFLEAREARSGRLRVLVF